MAQNTRKDPRAKVLTMTVRYRSATIDEFIEHHSYDVSRGGMFIKTPSPFPAGTLLKFEVTIAADQKVMQGVGRVVWKRETTDSDAERPCGMGVKFIKIDEESRGVIERLVSSRGQDSPSAYDSERTSDAPPASASARMFPSDAPGAPNHAPEDQTVMKPAKQLLEEALKQANAETTDEGSEPVDDLAVTKSRERTEAPASAPISTKPSAPQGTGEGDDHAAEGESAQDVPASDEPVSEKSAQSEAPAAAKQGEADLQPSSTRRSSDTPAAVNESKAPESAARKARGDDEAPAGPSSRSTPPRSAAEAEEEGGGRALGLFLAVAAVAVGIYFLTKRGHEVAAEPESAPATQQQASSPEVTPPEAKPVEEPPAEEETDASGSEEEVEAEVEEETKASARTVTPQAAPKPTPRSAPAPKAPAPKPPVTKAPAPKPPVTQAPVAKAPATPAPSTQKKAEPAPSKEAEPKPAAPSAEAQPAPVEEKPKAPAEGAAPPPAEPAPAPQTPALGESKPLGEGSP